MGYPEGLRKRIIVAAFAPAAYINPDLCQRVTHYVSKRDIVPYADPRGRRRYEKTIVLLDPAPGAKLLDHSFDSPTYSEAQISEINYYFGLLKR